MTDILGEPRFNIGDLCMSDEVKDLVQQGLLVHLYIDRHWRGDTGIISPDAIICKLRPDCAYSAFLTPVGDIYIATEPDEDGVFVTTVTTCEERASFEESASVSY